MIASASCVPYGDERAIAMLLHRRAGRKVQRWITNRRERSVDVLFAPVDPSFQLMEERDGTLVPTYDFQTPADRPLEFVNATT
jgi:hypothetical protein